MTNIGTKYILAQKFIFDPYSNMLTDTNDDNVVRLGSNESRILLFLIENSNQVVSRDQLHEYVWRDQGFQVDDSSLTQAISTLRKMLQDSTKSPQFIKTVPKRGYQLIAEIELASSSKVQEAPTNDTIEPVASENHAIGSAQESTSSSTTVSKSASTKPIEIEKEKNPLWLKLIWVIIILVPVLAWFSHAPKSGEFTRIELADNTPLLLPSNQADIDNWLPIIQQCTQRYKSKVKTPLIKVITTGGSRENIALNFIHDESNTHQNRTIVLFVNQTDYQSLCQ